MAKKRKENVKYEIRDHKGEYQGTFEDKEGGAEASRITKINRGHICSCTRGIGYYKSAGGYQWKYVNSNM